jgi:hypothetical protein
MKASAPVYWRSTRYSEGLLERLGLNFGGLVRPVRFERTAFCSGGKRSIQTELRALVFLL